MCEKICNHIFAKWLEYVKKKKKPPKPGFKKKTLIQWKNMKRYFTEEFMSALTQAYKNTQQSKSSEKC